MIIYNPMRPLNPVQAIGTAINLYRSNFLTYTRIALIAVGWSLIPSLSFFLLMWISALLKMIEAPTPVIGLSMKVLISLLIIVTLYCIAKTLMNNALISRLAFQELIQRSESVTKARRFLQPHIWNIVLAHFFTGLLLSVIILGVVIAVFINSVVRLGPLINLVALGLVFWFLTRFFIIEIPIAIEKNLSATKTISRSRELSQGSAFHILLIILLGGLATIPLLLLLVPLALPFIPDFRLVFSYLLSVVILSFWQSIKAVVYYNLRSYQEGVDLKLANRQSVGRSLSIPSRSPLSDLLSSTPPIATESDISQPTLDDISASSPPSTPAPTQLQSNTSPPSNPAPTQLPSNTSPSSTPAPTQPQSNTSPPSTSAPTQLQSNTSPSSTPASTQSQSSTSLKISTAAESIAQQLQQMEVDFSHLEAKHWQAIENYLQRRTKLNQETKQQTGLRLATGVKKVLRIKQLPQKMTADLFLEAVYCVHRYHS
ncbi:MAG: hypothetical protein F6K47_16395 [Symploca sp. SIO2E6]|nr:hypothetical protein [Symploca sp. SIO2E6]